MDKEMKVILKAQRKVALTQMSNAQNDQDFAKAKERFEAFDTALKDGCKWRISPDTLLTGAISLVSLALILGFDDIKILSSRAFSFMLKPRI